MRYRPEIDGLRAVSILAVVGYHAGVPGLSGGFVGVDVFFVISGFLITSLIRHDFAAGRFSFVTFYRRRVLRILPAAFAVLAAITLAAVLLSSPSRLEEHGTGLTYASLFGYNVFQYLHSGYFQTEAESNPLLHFWSLAIEEQFYFIFPLLFAGLWRFAGRWMLPSFAGIALLSLVSAEGLIESNASAAFFLVHTRAWELLTGSLLALAPPLVGGRGVREIASLGGLSMILAACFLYSPATRFPGVAALLPCAGAALVMAAAGESTVAGRLLRMRPLVFVGLISYSLYLWHWPVFVFAASLFPRESRPAIGTPLLIAASFLIASLSWRFIEQPFRRAAGAVDGIVFGRAGLVAIALALTGSLLTTWKGFPQRFQKATANWEASWTDASACRDGEACDRTPKFHRRVAFVGDSHVNMLRKALGVAGRGTGVTTLVRGKATCPPLSGLDAIREGEHLPCAEFNDSVLEELLRNDKVSDVVLGARWGIYLGVIHTSTALCRGSWCPTDRALRAGLVREGLVETIEKVRATGRKVWLLGPVPEVGYDVPEVLAAALMLGKPMPSGPEREAIEKRDEFTWAFLREIERTLEVPLVTVDDALCDARTCVVHEDGAPLYFDTNHLNEKGAMKLVPIFERMFTEIVAPRQQASSNSAVEPGSRVHR